MPTIRLNICRRVFTDVMCWYVLRDSGNGSQSENVTPQSNTNQHSACI